MAYQTGVLIGSGGMGEVFRAWDPVLDRPVALKYLRATSPELVSRLKREARAQARIDHPAVCRVYEVGDDDGRPYIAMQYVDGEPLDRAAAALSLEQKVLVVREVAEAVQAAHEVGLIHRDLKPANILVSEGDDGRPRPYVLDFGIAREQEVSGFTVTGQVIGTPGYLSPEQARGEVTGLDRRTDVFSLGVILYELIGGRRPFTGSNHLETLMALLEREPPPLRRVAPRVPRDLETIVMTCLAKRPDQRYPSARALADDLTRFLEGVPVLATRRGPLAHLAARARAHPKTATFAAVSLASVVVLSGLVLHARWSAARNARVAQRFGQRVERVVGRLDRVYLLPLHDVRPETARARAGLADIEGALDGLEPALCGLGESAVGRGYLALGEPGVARQHLERAWQLGERSPQTAWALGQALAELYREAVEAANGIRDPGIRDAALHRAEVELRAPAQQCLEQSAGGAEHPAYLAATLAFASADLDAALARLDDLEREEPFFYPGDLLAGAIERRRFEEASRSGNEIEAAAAFAEAKSRFRHAARVGESDPRPYEQLCALWVVALRDRFWSSGDDIRGARDAALDACGRALTADPDSPEAHVEAGRAHSYWAAAEADQGRDAVAALEAARRHAAEALDADPESTAAYILLGVAHRIAASNRAERGDDPEQELLAAVAAYKDAIRLRPDDHGAHMSLANSELLLGDNARTSGRDPRPFFTAAVDTAQRAVSIAPSSVGGHVNLGIAYAQLAIAARERGDAADELFSRGVAALEQAIQLSPSFLTAHFNLGEALNEKAIALMRRGVDPTPTLDRSLDVLGAVVDGYPTWAAPRYLKAEALALEAEWALRTGGDPASALARAAQTIARARQIRESDAAGLTKGCRAYLVDARWRRDRGRNPSAPVAEGLARLDDALRAHPGYEPALVLRARLLSVRAEWRVARNRSPVRDLERAAEAAAAAAAANPADAAAPATLARVWRLRAEWRLERGGDVGGAIRHGLEAADLAIAADPTRATAWSERTALHRAAAKAANDSQARRRELEEAAKADARARELDPLTLVG